jgi:putative ABC transport system substrate-binding protein
MRSWLVEDQMQIERLRRRDFITLAGAAVAWPFGARAQQPALPVVGLLDPTTPDAASADRLRAFRQGLRDAGFVEGENVAIEYRWAEGRVDQLSVLAAELVRRQVAVIVAIGGSTLAFAAKAETGTIPIVFTAAQDPVKLGLVASLAKPGGNLTESCSQPSQRWRLDLLRELVPSATRISVLLDPANATDTASILKDVVAAARTRGLQIKGLNASTACEVDAAFASFGREPPDALLVGPFSTDRRVQLAS